MYARVARCFFSSTFVCSRSQVLCNLKTSVSHKSYFNGTTWLGNRFRVLKPVSYSHGTQLLCTAHSAEPNSLEVYSGSLTKQVIRVKILSFSSSAVGLMMAPVVYRDASSLPVIIAVSSVLGFFTLVTPILLHLVTKRYVVRIIYEKDTDSYVADMITFFGTRRKVHFNPGEAQLPAMGGMLTSMEVRGIPMMVDFKQFDSRHYSRVLGFDKPLDIKIEELLDSASKSDKK